MQSSMQNMLEQGIFYKPKQKLGYGAYDLDKEVRKAQQAEKDNQAKSDLSFEVKNKANRARIKKARLSIIRRYLELEGLM